MIKIPILARGRLNALLAIARSAVCLSRILLLLVAVETLTMPFTQGIWSWDRFLHGGQDFELGLLIIVTCLCFLLLRVQQSERCFMLIFFMQALPLKARRRAATSFSFTLNDPRPQVPIGLPLSSAALPLRI